MIDDAQVEHYNPGVEAEHVTSPDTHIEFDRMFLGQRSEFVNVLYFCTLY